VERRGIICGGCWIVDYNNSISNWPEEETLAIIVSREIRGGGPAHNMGVDLARLGAPFPLWGMGVVGDDDGGRLLLDTCAEHGIDRGRIRVVPGVCTSHTDVMTVQGTGHRTFFHHQGANALVHPDDFAFAEIPARILHLGAPGIHETMDAVWGGDPNGWVTVLRRARAAGLRTNLEMVSGDPAGLRRLVTPCLPHLDSLIINDFEAGALAGVEVVKEGVTSVEGARRAAAILLGQGPMEVVVIHYPAGCVAAARDGRVLALPSVRVPPDAIKGANGAGDAFAAGVLFGLHQGWPLEDGLRLGLCAAAAALRSVSTTGSVAPAAECLALGRKWGWR
jgi:sugar/nucleoside kinase (ribokinase family)